MQLLGEMPVLAVARLVSEHDTRLWRVLHHYVAAARARADYAQVERVGVDETAARRGHDYITLFVDLDAARLLFATPGKESQTVAAFTADLTERGGAAGRVRAVACDMSPAFTKGVRESLPEAELTYDRFHVMQLLGAAVDEVRREEVRASPVLKGTRYLWLSNEENLRPAQQEQLAGLRLKQLKTGRAYALRLGLQGLYQQTDRVRGAEYLKRWYFWATHSRLEPVKKAARTIKAHWEGVLNWFASQATTGMLEGINSLVQAAKARARGYRSTRNLMAMAYLLAGKLHFELPT
jgi:transposase